MKSIPQMADPDKMKMALLVGVRCNLSPLYLALLEKDKVERDMLKRSIGLLMDLLLV